MQIVFGSILAISLLLAINFSGRIAAGRRIEDERDNLQEVIGTLQARATALRSELNFVQSDSYIEQWARAEGKMVKGDEMLVVPVPGLMTPAPIPTPFIPPQANDSRGETQNWRLWWQLFFDSPPPDDSSNR
jgi:cell division protein FtsB